MSVTIGVNSGPLVGREKGTRVTARQVRDRLDRELVGNVSLRVLPTERPDTWEVQGRGELALAVLVETMRREGYELTVGRPTVVTKDIDGVLHEPVERLAVDVPEEFLGAVTGLLAGRKGRMETMINHGTGWVRLDYTVPARGLIGFRTQFLTDTRGTAIAHHVFEGFEPWSGPMRVRPTGSLVADRSGAVTTYACFSLQERGSLMVAPGTEVYEGMIVGENSRSDDMDVNITRVAQAQQRAPVHRRGTGAAGAAPGAQPGAGAGVLRGRRVRGGHPVSGPAAQDDARRQGPGQAPRPALPRRDRVSRAPGPTGRLLDQT